MTLRKVLVVAAQLALVALITVALLEAVVIFSFRNPGLSPVPLPMLRQLHELFDRNTIQVMPECAQYDEYLTYTLRPGSCVFSNREFSNLFLINSLGLRDDEASLRAPTVVVLGDSIAMGWGVDQFASFPEALERLLDTTVLNAGISSYGTVRELRLLERIDRSRLRHLVIQYSANDANENLAYADGRFMTLSAARYQQTVEGHARLLSHFPGKHALNLLVLLRNLLSQPGDTPWTNSVDRENEVRAFITVLESSPVDLSHVHIAVVAIDAEFVREAEALARSSQFPWVRDINFIDLTDVTKIQDTFYPLDGHPKPDAHDYIALRLAEWVTRTGLPGSSD